jgi:hypothetical protein
MKSQLRSYLHSLFTRDKVESSIAAELRSHIELRAEDSSAPASRQPKPSAAPASNSAVWRRTKQPSASP